MLKFSANVGMLFADLPFLDRFPAAADAGFTAVEFPFPYGEAPEALAARCEQFQLEVVLFNLPPGDWAAGQRGLACDPEYRQRFQQSVGLGARYAEALGCRRLNCLAGLTPPSQQSLGVERPVAAGVSQGRGDSTLVDNLQYAAQQLSPKGIDLLTEPISELAMPGFFLSRWEHALGIVGAVNAGLSVGETVTLQCDLYHRCAMGERLEPILARDLNQIGHIQLADFPGRHEPGTGEIEFSRVFQLLEQQGYQGWIGCEYLPLGDTRAGLSWLEGLR